VTLRTRRISLALIGAGLVLAGVIAIIVAVNHRSSSSTASNVRVVPTSAGSFAGGPPTAAPVAKTPAQTVKLIEGYRHDALSHGDVALLDNYWSTHNLYYDHDVADIQAGTSKGTTYQLLVNVISVSSDNTAIVADLYLTFTLDGARSTEIVRGTYKVTNGRWYVSTLEVAPQPVRTS
jgi:hypothetical protein